MSSRKQRWALMGAGLGLVVSISAVSVVLQLPMSAAATAASAAAPAPAVPVTVSKVSSRNFTHWELFSGRLEAVERVDVRPRVGGAIQSVHFREGALVKAGDLLFTIDPAPYQAAVDQAEGQFASAEAKVDLARIELDRGLKLSGNSTISQSDMDQRRNSFTQAQAAMGTARAQLQSAQLELDYTQVRAPVSGRVGKLEVTAGNLVASGSSSSVLTTLVSVDPIYASFNVSEQLVAKALSQLPQTGAALADIDRIPVEIGTLADDGTPIKGKLQLINNQVDAASGTIGVRAVFDNPGGRLIPGQFVRVRMGQPVPENKILVSERAIGTDQDKKFVFVVDGDNKVNYRQIQLGAVAEGQRVVESGLAAGDTIVVNGLQRIKPGAIVAPQPEEKLAASK
ncbi:MULTISPECIES: efflux RND transporter periplasmic adaptor subunit [Rhizobium/Agrobacterium group]|uniref:efflux RND transporter periplasmic adaptor subunit n=1 Tax=Rhizobium/Agrobacterium group TaxID=227290 RepID=UPI0012E7072E|nr:MULTISPECIES: efflux RND transporter periplasmic adaptor subunit [Rhizobium/Agrobacterium group]MCF1460777.1 efflux RND transporter periplasmic adaptor subunit [Allorhizobium ampelinum]MCF1472069.1 efflux RND transporter periplasmic adaptor subunit [Allorhizobium ampelinum]MVA49269.1 efflux RND transporter periplasmic adaptor subunit [Agrobacterium vitis]NSZ54749.1 efflux RND transporter periplasmic adaptor subunit [Agrobacterium vitis]NTA33741.1 efflux RND transporter periplasmic adaptor s